MLTPLPNLNRFQQWPKVLLQAGVIGLSVFICLCLSLARLPGTEIAGVGANWFLIWVVCWSLKRNSFDSAIAGLGIGLIVDGLTGEILFLPTHIFGFIVVGFLTASLQKERYIQEDFISVALIAFAMAVLFETLIAIQLSIQTETQEWLPFLINPPVESTSPAEFLLLDPVVDPAVVNRVGFTLGEIWLQHQRIALGSAIVSSLWAPIVYYPLNRFWAWIEKNDRL
ncbi:MAG: rod shape-determining protein MreD [Prochlorotrichaceae cyanobacterium]|jgi:rod shape-determining protein MreD